MNNDLISRSALLEDINFDRRAAKVHPREICERFERFCDYAEEVVNDALAVDAEVVRHGRYDAGGDCTVCGYPMPTDDRCDAIFPGEIKYCYNCGAKMDAEVQDADQ